MANENWVNALSHPQLVMIRKYVSQILKDRYGQHDELMQRICGVLVTQKDLEDFGRFVVDIYEVSYLKCVEDHRQALEKVGQKAIIKPGEFVNHKPIFQEKSGCSSDGTDVTK